MGPDKHNESRSRNEARDNTSRGENKSRKGTNKGSDPDTPAQLKRHAREMVLKVLYEVELAGLDGAEARAAITRRLRRPDELEFALALLDQTLENMDED